MQTDVKNIIGEIKIAQDKAIIQAKRTDMFRLACEHFGLSEDLITRVLLHSDEYLKIDIFQRFVNDLFEDPEERRNILVPFHESADRHREKVDIESRKEEIHVLVQIVESITSHSLTIRLPGKEYRTDMSAFIIENEIPFLLTLGGNFFMGRFHDDDFYSEQRWIEKETVKLIAALNLSIDHGRYSFFLSGYRYWIHPKKYGFEYKGKLDDEFISHVKETIKFLDDVTVMTKGMPLEISKTMFSYDFGSEVDEVRFERLKQAINTADGVLMRSLYCYTKACAFVMHQMMMEEATALLFFCLDGVVKLFMKKYNLQKVDDLAPLLLEKFGCPYGDWLNDCYDERTIYVHPANRIGEYWCPPWDVDTCYETFDLVRIILNIYLLEEFVPVPEGFDLDLYLGNTPK